MLMYSPYNTRPLITTLIPGPTDTIDSHYVSDLCEILSSQFDVTCRAILEGALDVSGTRRIAMYQRCSDTVRNSDSRAAWDGYDLGPQRCYPCNA